MLITNLFFGAFGTGMFVIDKFNLGGELISMLATTLLPWAQVSNAGAAIVNAFFLYLSYNTPKSNPFSDPRYINIFLMNEVADILGLKNPLWRPVYGQVDVYGNTVRRWG